MPIMFKLFSLLGWAKKALTALLDLARRYPREAAIIALLIALAWTWHGNTKRDRVIAKWETAAKAWQSASDANKAAAIAQVKATEAKFTKAAKESDNAHDKELAQAMSAADRYAITHRVRAERGSVSTASAASEGQDSGVHEVPAAATELVAISTDDLKICTANSVYAKSAYDWTQRLIAEGVGF